jgi:hypothetical protein
MTDHADIVRDWLALDPRADWEATPDDFGEVVAALDALVAERDALLADSIGDRLGFGERLDAAEAEVARLKLLLTQAKKKMSLRSYQAIVVRAEEGRSAAEAEVARPREALADFAEHGTRFDCNPTVMIHNTPEWVASQEWWQKRATDMDVAVRNRARAALATTEEGK